MHLALLAVLTICIQLALAQIFSQSGLAYDLMGTLSKPCVSVLNTTVSSCSSLLSVYTRLGGSADVLPATALSLICVPQCKTDLTSLRTRIRSSCNATTDIMVFDGIAYPATFMLDNYALTYDISCSKDKTTGEFCDVIINNWRNSSTPVNQCADCILSPFAKQLSSPLGYDADNAAAFNSITASCGAAGYPYTSPTAYALNTTAPTGIGTSLPTPTPLCSGQYAVAAGDTCLSISSSKNVSTYGLISRNNLDLNCTAMPTKICLPATCKTYKWAPGNQCKDISSQFNISLAQFLAWNPIFDSQCSNTVTWNDWTVCVGPPGGTIPVAPPPSAVPVPSNAVATSEKNCAQWYTVKEGDNCFLILPPGSSVNFAQFRVLNPQIDADCTNLWLGNAYCIRPVNPVSIPASTTFTRPPTTTRPAVTVSTIPASPYAAGTENNCATYGNFIDLGILDPSLFPSSNTSAATALNSCSNVAKTYAIRVEDLRRWNPSLPAGTSCALQKGLSYCVGGGSSDGQTATTIEPPTGTGSSTSTSKLTSTSNSTSKPITTSSARPSTTSTANPSTTSVAAPPGQTQTGTIATCKTYHKVVAGDGCWDIANAFGITLDDFYKWNPGVGTDCSALWLDYYVCVAV